MRARVRQVEGQGDLRIARSVGFDAGGRAAQRAQAVGADRELRRDDLARTQPDRSLIVACFDGAGFILDALERRQLVGASVQRRPKVTVLDVVAERFEPDLVGRETHLGRADQPRRVVDDPHHAEGGGVGPAARPDAERVERGHGTGQQGGGAVVVVGSARDQHGFDAGFGQRNRRREPRRASADDRHLNG